MGIMTSTEIEPVVVGWMVLEEPCAIDSGPTGRRVLVFVQLVEGLIVGVDSCLGVELPDADSHAG